MLRNTPLKRTPLHSKVQEGEGAEKKVRDGTCAHCGTPFLKLLPMQRVCGPVCAGKRAKAARLEKVKAEKAHTRARKLALKSVKRLKAEAQDSFNDFIRFRDRDLPCVSCGETNPPMKPGGQWDAGHFKSRGAYPELAFDEDNCHKQCKSCNAGSGKFAHKERTVNAAYEVELLRRIGPERLARLNGPHVVKPLDRDELIAIKTLYRAKRKELEATR